MKQRLVKKLIPITMTALMMAGCTNTKEPSVGKQSEQQDVGKQSEQQDVGKQSEQDSSKKDASETTEKVDMVADPYGKYEKPISISVLSTDSKSSATNYDSSNPDLKSASENVWITAYEKYLNIKVDRQIAEDRTALNARINTAMASSTLPDIMIVSKDMFYTLAENDVLLDLSDSYQQYSSVYGRLLSEAVGTSPESILAGEYDGKLLGFPVMGNSYVDTEVLYIRQDWLDKVQMKAPTTMADLEAVAKAFMDNKLGGENTRGIGIYNISRSLIAPYGAVLDTWQKGNDGKYVYGNVTDPVKQGLQNLQKFYKEGLIKSDFAVSNKTNILEEEIANGQVGVFYGQAWNGATSVNASLMNDPKAVWIPVRIPTLDGKPVKQWTNNTIGQFYVVNKNCKNPEALFKMIELELHMYYETSSDEPLFQMYDIKVFRNFNRADLDLYKCEIIGEACKKNTPAEGIKPIARGTYEMVLAGKNGMRDNLGLAITYLEAYPIVNKLVKENYLVAGYNGPNTENIALYQTTINEALNNEYLKIVMGDDISNFDKAVKNWYDNGGKQITEEVNQYYQGLGK